LQAAIERCSVTHMASIPKATDLAALSVADRLDLMDQIWSSLTPDVDSIPVPEWHRVENERRMAALEADGVMGRPAEDVIRDLKSQL
jgi:putative addiction module component (TIGR02574 family)